MSFTSGISSGLPELDRTIRGVLAGDNIVWRVDQIGEYAAFVRPFAEHALATGRPAVYFRFANHAPVLDDQPDNPLFLQLTLDPAQGFEGFLDAVHDTIEATEKGAYYVFDSLSDLSAAWHGDAMLCNFFLMTCPCLYDRGDLASFALLRDRHSNEAVLPIRNTCQVMLDAYRKDGTIFVRPLKTQQRFSPTIHMLHRWEGGALTPIAESHVITGVLKPVPPSAVGCSVRPLDAWNRAFMQAQDLLTGPPELLHSELANHLFETLLRMLISHEERVLGLARRHLTLADLLEIGRRTVGTGLIGGKSVGMLLAHAILRGAGGAWAGRLEMHDSFYIGSDCFYTFLVRNGCWWMRRRQKAGETLFEEAEQARRRILTGKFLPEFEGELERIMEYFSSAPIIVRSSSLLEDAFGNSFAGKYDSVFCANQGSFHQRMEDLKTAIRTVYASAMSASALAYRKAHGLLEREEQMGLLIQRVSGTQHGQLFFPDLAGVGFSFNPYVWNPDIDPAAGVLRMVFGLGTRAVDRSDSDYTRLVALNAPDLSPETRESGQGKCSQRIVDVLDLDANQLVSLDFGGVVERGGGDRDRAVARFSHRDPALVRAVRAQGSGTVPLTITFDRMIRDTSFIGDMREALRLLQKAYDYPVDVEFTANFPEDGVYKLNIVQCRPLQVKGNAVCEPLPAHIPDADLLLRARGPVIGPSRSETLDTFIYVVPGVYSSLPNADRYRVARTIGRVTQALKGARVMLLGPGRWGTTTPSLGVPVSFAEIHPVAVLCEIVAMRDGLVPDVSLGTHFFSELVEQDMLYIAVYPEREETVLRDDFFLRAPNLLLELAPEAALFADTLKVVRVAPKTGKVRLHANVLEQEVVCFREPSAAPGE